MPKRKLPKGKSKSAQELSPEEAIAAIGLITMTADDQSEEVEGEMLAAILQEIDTFEAYSEDELSEVFDKIASIAEEEGGEALLNSALDALSNEDLRDAAMMTAMLVIASDDDIPEEEEQFLEGLRILLKISEDRYNEIIDELFGEIDEEAEDEE